MVREIKEPRKRRSRGRKRVRNAAWRDLREQKQRESGNKYYLRTKQGLADTIFEYIQRAPNKGGYYGHEKTKQQLYNAGIKELRSVDRMIKRGGFGNAAKYDGVGKKVVERLFNATPIRKRVSNLRKRTFQEIRVGQSPFEKSDIKMLRNLEGLFTAQKDKEAILLAARGGSRYGWVNSPINGSMPDDIENAFGQDFIADFQEQLRRKYENDMKPRDFERLVARKTNRIYRFLNE